MEFNSIELHDSTLESISYLWKSKRVTLEGLKYGSDNSAFKIVFEGVHSLLVPQEEDWGPSISINGLFHSTGSSYVIEMQSGDNIQIIADSFNYVE